MIIRSVRNAPVTLLILLLIGTMSPLVQAHLMAAQHGTLNIVDEGAFMVLSLPISSFEGVDEDHDGKVSMVEFNNHRAAIVESVGANVTLSDKEGVLPLQGIMLSPEVPHGAAKAPLSKLIVMGRFSLAGARGALRFQVGLFGKHSDEQLLKITATHKPGNQEYVFELTPAEPAGVFFF